jgi:hypothetical protein
VAWGYTAHPLMRVHCLWRQVDLGFPPSLVNMATMSFTLTLPYMTGAARASWDGGTYARSR